jgi:prepilin-type N-terminal cleavage/methylation domain-containing protein
MNGDKRIGRLGCGGFTLPEVLVASAISVLVVAGMIGFFVSTLSYWHKVNLRIDADREVNIAMSRMVYGMEDRFGLRAASALSVQIVAADGGGWTVNYDTGGDSPQTNSFTFSPMARTLVFNPGSQIAGRDIAAGQVVRTNSTLVISLRVEKEDGRLHASREIATTVYLRNL